MAAERTAEVRWNGSLMDGAGTIVRTGSGAVAGLEVTWASRAEPEEGGRTSPEELLAAAHAACFSMALSHGLAQAETPPTELNVMARSTFVPGEGITQMKLDVTGTVEGIGEAAFAEAAAQAAENCPVSKALAGNVEILVDARLQS